MAVDFQSIYREVRDWAASKDIDVEEIALPSGKAGEFNGISVSMNAQYTVEERTYYLIHAIGSIVCWSLDKPAVEQMFARLREAKGQMQRQTNPQGLTRAIEGYRAFESESSEFAVGLFMELGHVEAVVPYSNFMRADLEAMTEFHRTGKAPRWDEFFSVWNGQVGSGQRHVACFSPKPVPMFRPAKIEVQEILQEQ